MISFLQSKITYLNLCASVASYISTPSGCMGEQQTKFATSPGCMGEQQTKFATSHFNEAGRKLKLAARLCTLCGIKGFCLQNPANPERTKGAYQLERSPKKDYPSYWNAPPRSLKNLRMQRYSLKTFTLENFAIRDSRKIASGYVGRCASICNELLLRKNAFC